MLGDSVKRRLGKPRRSSRPKAESAGPPGRRWTARHWLAVLFALTLPFVLGYLIAIRVLFPPPPVVAQGIVVPDLVGKVEDAARRELAALGLGDLAITALPSSDIERGTITAQSPLPGQQVRPGAGIRVAVSSGPPRVVIPDVIGFPVDRAASLLTRLGFQVQREEEEVYDEPGRVLRLDPSPGTERELPARVTITFGVARPDTMPMDTTLRRDTLELSLRWSPPRRGPTLQSTSRLTSNRVP